MTRVGIVVEGVDRALAQFARLEVATEVAVKLGTAKGAGGVEARAKELAPVLSGDLQRSIHTKLDPKDGGLLVGTDLYYGRFQEYGTHEGGVVTRTRVPGTKQRTRTRTGGTQHIPPHPFLRPAADGGAGDLKEGIAEALTVAIRGVAGL
jgi:HK97 gp10 family phage protein